jgi:hypothetical protein
MSQQFPLAASFAHQQVIGNVGGVSSVWQPASASLTRPANTNAYANNGAIGSSTSVVFKFPGFFRANGGSALLSGLRAIASVASIATTNMGAITAHLFNASPSAALGLGDQGTWTTLLADDASKVGTVSFSTWTIGGTGSNLIESYGTPIIAPLPMIGAQTPAPGAADLYAVLVATAVFTPASAQVIQLYASGVLD